MREQNRLTELLGYDVPWVQREPSLMMTPGFHRLCIEQMPEFGQEGVRLIAYKLMRMFFKKNWGLTHLEGEDRQHDIDANEYAVNHGGRVMGVYDLEEYFPMSDMAGRVWMILEADHSGLTFLLPEEY